MKKGYLISFAVLGSIANLIVAGHGFSEEVKKEEVKKAEELPEVVVTATRTEIPVEASPASVNVVTKEKMKKRNIKTLDDVINELPGVYVHRTRVVLDTPTDSISLRGIPGYRRNLVIIDGVPINGPQGGELKLSGLRFEDVERIEVVKGPFSALYGGLAMGGVVNIITLLPQKREFYFKTGYGSSFNRGKALDDLRKVYFSYGDKVKNKLSFLISYGHEATNGFPSNYARVMAQPPSNVTGWEYTTTPEGDPRWIVGDTGDHKGWNQSFTFRVGYDISKNTQLKFSIMRVWGSSSYDEPHSYLRDPSGNIVWNYYVPPSVPGGRPNMLNEAMFLAGKIAKDYTIYSFNFETLLFNKIKTKVTLGLNDNDDYLFTTPCVGTLTGCAPNEYAQIKGGPGTTHNTPSKNYIADIQFNLPLEFKTKWLNTHILTFGASYRKAEAETKQYKLSNWKNENSKNNLIHQTEGKDRIYALFIQDEIPVTKRLTIYLGARKDWWKTFDGYQNWVGQSGYPKEYEDRTESSFNPKASFVYKVFENTTLRGSIGKAFRPPMIIELYRSFMTPGSFIYGNPELKPEKSTSWDLGMIHSFWKGNRIEITYFENYLKDLIYNRATGKYIGPRQIVETVNAGKAKVKGIEFSGEQKLTEWARIFLNFTWTDAKIKENPAKPTTEGKRITGIPEAMFNIGIELEKGPFSAFLIGRYRSKVYGNDENKDKKENVFGSYDSYFIADAKFTYKFFKNAFLSMSIDNLFDKKYYYFYLQPRRSWYLEFNYKF